MSAQVPTDEEKNQVILRIVAKGRERIRLALRTDPWGDYRREVWEQGCKREYDRLREEWDASGWPDWDAGNQIFWTVYELWDNECWHWQTEEARAHEERRAAKPPAKPQGQKIEWLGWTLIAAGIMLNLCALGWIPFVSQWDWQQDLIAQDLEPPGFWPSVLPLLMVAAGIALLLHLKKAEKKLAPRCPTCGQQVSRSARRCPHCERPLSPQDHAEEPK